MQILRVGGVNAPWRAGGCEEAPVEILKALKEIPAKENGIGIDFSNLDLEEIHVDNENIEKTQKLIYENAKEEFEKGGGAIFLGGDHSISCGIVKAFNEIYENCFLIVFDAHVDCMKPGREPTHEEWLRRVVEAGFKSENIILISCRNIWPEERKFLKEKNIQIIGMNDILEDREGICDLIMERAQGAEALYVSVDIDCVDPAFAPGTGYLEPGGLSSRDLIYFIQRLRMLENFKGADIVEINPKLDVGGRTIKLGAKILGEMI